MASAYIKVERLADISEPTFEVAVETGIIGLRFE
jgi:hypothetical protein